MSSITSVWKTFFLIRSLTLKKQSDYQMLTRNLRKRGLESNKLEVVVVKIYTPLTEVKNNSKQSDHQGMELTLTDQT